MPVAEGGSLWRRLFAFAGPGYLIAVGYMDPGNWATDIAGGSAFGYTLLFVILLSNLMAILLQALSVRLGVATGRDLAQACRDHYAPPVALALWILCELAIIACDLAEVIGTAIALQLLFGIPLVSLWRRLFAFAGPGYLIAVGYMDPGNWATDIAGGSAFGYTLLFVILLSNLMAILLQALSVRTRRRDRSGSRAGLPRPLFPAGGPRPVASLRACDHRL